jgi:hypothetical protein
MEILRFLALEYSKKCGIQLQRLTEQYRGKKTPLKRSGDMNQSRFNSPAS